MFFSCAPDELIACCRQQVNFIGYLREEIMIKDEGELLDLEVTNRMAKSIDEG